MCYFISMVQNKKSSALVYILKALIPYSRQNIALSYKPAKFFADIEKASGYSKPTLNETLRRAGKKGLVEQIEGQYKLTNDGEKTVKLYFPKVLKNNVELMVIFDIPEKQSNARQQLRSFLKKCKFQQTQKSVWVTKYDYIEALKDLIDELNLKEQVLLYEASHITIT